MQPIHERDMTILILSDTKSRVKDENNVEIKERVNLDFLKLTDAYEYAYPSL